MVCHDNNGNSVIIAITTRCATLHQPELSLKLKTRRSAASMEGDQQSFLGIFIWPYALHWGFYTGFWQPATQADFVNNYLYQFHASNLKVGMTMRRYNWSWTCPHLTGVDLYCCSSIS